MVCWGPDLLSVGLERSTRGAKRGAWERYGL